MAREIYTLNYTGKDIDRILNKGDVKPFVRWHDEGAGVYRFFPDEEKLRAWVEAMLNDDMTPEIAAYEFTEPITAPAPFTINITITNDNKAILEGTEGNTLDFTFMTTDGKGEPQPESVDVYYTFRSPSGTKTTAAVYNPGTEVHMNIDNYISLGTNTVTIMVRGRSTNTTKTVVATYRVVKLELTSTFQIARSLEANTPFNVAYTVRGDGDKTIDFYIDGGFYQNELVSSLEPVASKVKRIDKYLEPGKHTLQIQAKMQIGEDTFKSKLLYYEFIVKGAALTTTVIAEQFPSTQNVFSGSIPGLNGEQYVIKEIEWAYYSSDYAMQNVTIVWRLYTAGGVETPIATRNADVVSAETDVPPEPLKFMPMESGSYHLQALINGNIIGDYTIAVIPNTAGILETTSGLTMKLSGLGRDNSEPPETLTSWSNRGYSTQFFNQPWNGNSGWNDNALVLNGGATARINNKPFAEEISPTRNNGCVFEIDFETFNVFDDDAELLRISASNTSASLVITPSKATLRSSLGRTVVSRFKSDERIKIAFVIYPNSGSDYEMKAFVYNNGVMSGVMNYVLADSFDIGSRAASGSTDGMINLGNVEGQAGIKIYYLRTYSNYINMYEELNNYFIDSGENLQYLVNDNDIYAPGTKTIDIDKLEGTITTVKFTGPLNELIDQGGGKHSATCALEVVNPTNSNINLKCSRAEVTNAGQSTLNKPVPSFHVKLDKNGNICYDRDGKPYSKNRWVFREGNVPEKKFRLQANYMDSSGCHNGAFFRMFNEVAPKVSINNQNVLRIPSEVYASENYPQAMRLRYGEDPSGNNWKFPYRINMVPDSIPCVVVWRPDENDSYRFLGQYVIMEEKKANYANGMHSIYSGLDSDGNADPFGFKSTKTGDKLWDNVNCHQFEFLRSTSNIELFLDDADWDEDKETAFELVYPDEDDLTPEELSAEWNKFHTDVVHPIIEAYKLFDPQHPEVAQNAFNQLMYGPNPVLDRWHFAAYYCLAMRNACTDSMVRNMELVTYDGTTWLPKWWDVDMQCGLQQSGACDIEPTSDRYTLIPGTTDAFAFSGRIFVEVGGQDVLRSSWLWDALVGNTWTGITGSAQFMEDVKIMDEALYKAGWKYTEMTKLQDEEYIDAWSDALFNESSVSKYLAYNDLLALQGDRTPHRHWFLKTSYDYFDALNVCGEYTSKVISIRTQSISPPKYIRFKAAFDSYFGWGHTTTIEESGIQVEKGKPGILTVDIATLQNNDPIQIYAANKISEIDLSEISTNLFADIKFEGTYDTILGSQLRKAIIGAGSLERLNTGKFNLYNEANRIIGSETLDKLEYLDIRGMQRFSDLVSSNMKSLKHLYAAGSGLDSFNPASGSEFKEIELPTTVFSMQMDGCKLTDSNNHCVIKWYKTIYEDELPVRVEETTVPPTLRALLFSGMGSDKGTQELIFTWLRSVNTAYGDAGLSQLQLTCNNVNWTGVQVSDLLLLSKIPLNSRKVTGRIVCSGELTGEQVVAIDNAFYPNGDGTVFTSDPRVSLRVDAPRGFVIAAPSELLAGNSTIVSGISFPIEGGTVSEIKYRLGTYDEFHNFVPRERFVNAQGKGYYQFKDTTLYEDTGEVVTRETTEPDYQVVVRGYTDITGNNAPILIKKRTYPSSIVINVEHTPGSDVSYDEPNNSYYVASDDLRLILTDTTIPPASDINGTLVENGEVWTISSEIAQLCRIVIDTETGETLQSGTTTYYGNTLILYIQDSGETLSEGTITHTKTYITGLSVSKVTTFRFKSPVRALTSACNPQLQNYVYTAGYASTVDYTTDIKLWFITSLNYLGGALGVGSTLIHLGELNSFLNLNMQVLDLSNCTNLGSNSNLVQLEDTTWDYVNYLPRKSQTLIFDFREINMAGTRLAGVNLKPGNTLREISYSDYTEEVIIQNQTALTEVNIPENASSTLEKIVIEGCSNLEEIIWT